MFKKPCDHSDTRLTCVDCNKPICPSCMVVCAVGNRCNTCTKGFESHITKLGPWVLTKVIVLSFLSSIAIFFSALAVGMIPLIGCWLNLLAAGACGYLSGNFIHKVSGYKYGPKLLPYVLIPLLVGFVTNPFGSPLPYLVGMLTLGLEFDPEALMSFSLLPAIGVLTVMIPFLRTR